jgi:hypothetical protein
VNWESISSPSHEIRDLKSTVRDSEVHLSWFWSNEIDFVYIYKTTADHVKPISELEDGELKFYTREEYKVNQGYVSRLESFGRFAYRIFPCQKRDGQLFVFKQENENNLITISGSRAKIYCSISYKNRLFQSRKKVKMSIMTELPLGKELLVYVKKSGGVPVSIDDGTVYPFVRSFPSGKTAPPEIEIDKNEYIKIFLSKGMQAAQKYELIAE